MRVSGIGPGRAVVFDWGDTVMRDFGHPGPMAHWDTVEVVPGVRDALARLEKSYVLSLASNAGDSDGSLMAQALERVHLRKHFVHLWTSKELGARKPDPAFFHAICDRLQLPPAAVMLVGNDYYKDIAPAKAVGMGTVWFNPSNAPCPGDAADQCIVDMRVLPETILGMRRQLGPPHPLWAVPRTAPAPPRGATLLSVAGADVGDPWTVDVDDNPGASGYVTVALRAQVVSGGEQAYRTLSSHNQRVVANRITVPEEAAR